MPRFKLTIEYDGTNYYGWQRQQNALSVQQAIEEALFKATGHQVAILGAGRTDAGVHAMGQVAHLDLEHEWPEDKLRQAINAHLKLNKQRVRILVVQKVDPEFHARFSAIKRHYKYLILNRPSDSPLMQDKVWHIFKPLDVEAMQDAATVLVGRHDFTSFRAKHCQAKNPVITMEYINISKQDDLITIEVAARSFLHHMIRNIVGCLKQIGDHKLTKDEMRDILVAKDRNLAPATARASGLYFWKVEYPNNILSNDFKGCI